MIPFIVGCVTGSLVTTAILAILLVIILDWGEKKK